MIRLSILVWLLLISAAHGASFDCAKAHSTFEHVICGQKDAADRSNMIESRRQELIKLDDELNGVYREALGKYFDPALLRREQLAWLKARERCVRDTYCSILSLYHDRIDNLRYDLIHPPKTPEEQANARLLSMGSPPGDNFKFNQDASFKGYGLGLCEAMVRWINKLVPKGDMQAPYRILTSMPEMVEPTWQELDIQEHKELFAELVKFQRRMNTPEKAVEKEIKDGLAGAYTLWMTREDVYGDSKLETLVMFSRKNDLATPSERYAGSPQIVTDDLRSVDKQANINVMSLGGKLLDYKGKPYSISVYPNSGYASGGGVICEINNFKRKGSTK